MLDVNQPVQKVLDGRHAAQDDGMEGRHPLLLAVTQLETQVPDTLQCLQSVNMMVSVQQTQTQKHKHTPSVCQSHGSKGSWRSSVLRGPLSHPHLASQLGGSAQSHPTRVFL